MEFARFAILFEECKDRPSSLRGRMQGSSVRPHNTSNAHEIHASIKICKSKVQISVHGGDRQNTCACDMLPFCAVSTA